MISLQKIKKSQKLKTRKSKALIQKKKSLRLKIKLNLSHQIKSLARKSQSSKMRIKLKPRNLITKKKEAQTPQDYKQKIKEADDLSEEKESAIENKAIGLKKENILIFNIKNEEEFLENLQLEKKEKSKFLEDFTNFLENLPLELLASIPNISPLEEGRLTSHFGYRTHPVTGEHNKMHLGMDIASPSGTDVYATGYGTVSSVIYHIGYGYTLVVDHINYYEDKLQARYAHLLEIFVKEGQTVKTGDVLASVGSTGLSTGPHLHYEIFFNGIHLDPKFFNSSPRDSAELSL